MNIHSAIQDAIKKCNLVFFVGAGFSRPLGLPNWTELVKVITDDLKKDYPNDKFIGNIVDMIHQKYHTEIEALDKLRPKHLSRILSILETTTDIDLSGKGLGGHRKIWEITDQVVTTNYDKAFDLVAPEKSPKVVYGDDFHISRLSGMDSFLFKVHGSIEHPAQCVLFSEQYKKLYDGRTGAALELFHILSGKTIIFLGFSLNDPFVNELLTLRREAYQGLKQNNFIITMDEKDFSEYGVEKIEDVKNYGADLDEFLDELVRIRENYPYGLGMLIRGLMKEGKEFNIEVVRKNYFEFVGSLEAKPGTAAVVEEVKAGEFASAEGKLRAEFEEELQAVEERQEKAAQKAFELAELKKMQLKYEEALEYYRKTVSLSPDNDIYHNSLGLLLKTLGRYSEAIEYYEKAEAINLRLSGKENDRSSVHYSNMGRTWLEIGNYEKALSCCEKAMTIGLKSFKKDAPEIAIIFNNMALVLRMFNRYKEAIKYMQKALTIDLKIYGERHARISSRYNHIGLIYRAFGEYNKALEYFQKSIEIDFENQETHPFRAATRLNNMALAWRGLGEYKKAIKLYEEALENMSTIFAHDHPQIKKITLNLEFARKKSIEDSE